MRWKVVTLIVAWTSAGAVGRAQEGLPAAVVDQVKAATVRLRANAGDQIEGTGFVVGASQGTCYIATNAHLAVEYTRVSQTQETVSTLPPNPFPGRPSLARQMAERSARTILQTRTVKQQIPIYGVTVIFRCGQKDEWSGEAKVVASDRPRDLALLKVDNVPNPPAPLEPSTSGKLYETMRLYAFGFPQVTVKAAGGKNPTVTVSKASVAALSYDKQDRLVEVRLDGNLNPGHHGGPVISTKGQLVAIAADVVSKGISRCIPSRCLTRLCGVTLGEFQMTPQGNPNDCNLAANIRMVDPLASDPGMKATSATLYYVTMSKASDVPSVFPLGDDPAATSVPLKIDNLTATAEFTIDLKGKLSAAVCAQVKTWTGDGTPVWGKLAVASLKKVPEPPPSPTPMPQPVVNSQFPFAPSTTPSPANSLFPFARAGCDGSDGFSDLALG